MGLSVRKENQLKRWWGHAASRVRGNVVPALATAQPERIGHLLPYRDFFVWEGSTLVLLADGSLGTAWRVGLVGHEALTGDQLTGQMQAIVHAVESVANDRATVQVIWDQTPTGQFQEPPYAAETKTYAQVAMKARMEAIAAMSGSRDDVVRCVKRQGWLTMRWQRNGEVGLETPTIGDTLSGKASPALEQQATRFAGDVRDFREAITLFEEGLSSAGIGFVRCDRTEFIRLARTGHHSTAARERGWPEVSDEPVTEQIALEAVTATGSAIQLGDTSPDVVQVLTWAQKPPAAYEGMLTSLLRLHEPLRVVLNIRPCNALDDLAKSEFFLKFAMDAMGRRQMAELADAQQRLAHGERAYHVTLHVLVRNTDCTIEEAQKRNAGQLVANRLKQLTGIPFVVEAHAAPLLFWQTAPLGFSPSSGIYSRRERRVFTKELSKYLPLYSGFAGTRTKSQLMLSRAGEPIYFSPLDNDNSPHMAVLGSSGAGKSFFMVNHLTGARALVPRSLDFIIDRKTSYEILARFIGEEGGCAIAKPPATFPNMFLGEMDDDRLAVIVAILRAAITLATPKADLTAEHSVILAESVRRTFSANRVDAETVFEDGELKKRAALSEVLVPRLSTIADKFTAVCTDKGIQLEQAAWLRGKLSPFCGTGPYAKLFDEVRVAAPDIPTPAITLYDLDGVASDAVLSTLTAMVCTSDIIRQMKRPENIGRTGRLVVEELGALGKSPDLEEFIRVAWKTCRKLGYSCIGLTNEVDDYRKHPAPRTVWNVSPTKIVLGMTIDDLKAARSEDKVNGIPKLINSDHEAAIIASLAKRGGVFSQGLFISLPACLGSFTYTPTGWDYWLAASKPSEVGTVHRLAERIGGRYAYFRAVSWLAANAPSGFRDERDVRAMSDEELTVACEQIAAASAPKEGDA